MGSSFVEWMFPSKGWKKFLAAVLFGVLASFVFTWSVPYISPNEGWIFDAWYQSVFAYFFFVPVILLISKQRRARDVFLVSLVFSFVYYYFVIYWVNIAVIVYGGISWVVSVFAVGLLVLYMAGILAVSLGLGKYVSDRFGLDFMLMVPLFWAAHEYTKNYLFTGFPWGQVGYSQVHLLAVLQSASIWGVYGVSMLVVAINVVFARMLLARIDSQGKSWTRTERRYAIAVGVVFLFVLLFGFYRIYKNDELQKDAPRIKVALLQGSIDQNTKNYARHNASYILKQYYKLIDESQAKGAELFVWPEAAYPYLLHGEMQDASALFRKGEEAYDWQGSGLSGYTLLGAAVCLDCDSNHRSLGNSVLLIAPNGKVLGRHDKTHLVPFGEYVPMKKLLSLLGVKKIVKVMGNFSPGKVGHLLSFPIERDGSSLQIKTGNLICYEGIFPEISRRFVNEGANLLVNLTNDAWYGMSSGPYQHLYMYAFRSVENRRATVRAANTGISAFIDISGRIYRKAPLFRNEALIDEAPLVEDRTVYSYVGDFAGWGPFWFLWGGLLWLIVRRFMGRAKRKGESKP